MEPNAIVHAAFGFLMALSGAMALMCFIRADQSRFVTDQRRGWVYSCAMFLFIAIVSFLGVCGVFG